MGAGVVEDTWYRKAMAKDVTQGPQLMKAPGPPYDGKSSDESLSSAARITHRKIKHRVEGTSVGLWSNQQDYHKH